jgi:Rrf2 family protein
MLYTKSVGYAIRAMIYLSEKDNGTLTNVDTIAKALNIPKSYLSKLFQQLVRSRLVESTRGRGGGVKLIRMGKTITLLDVIKATEGPLPDPERCILGLGACSDVLLCPLYDHCLTIKSAIEDQLHHQSLADLAPGHSKYTS